MLRMHAPWQIIAMAANYALPALMLLGTGLYTLFFDREWIYLFPELVIPQWCVGCLLLGIGIGLYRKSRVASMCALVWPWLPIAYGGWSYLRCQQQVAAGNDPKFIAIALLSFHGMMLFGLLFLPTVVMLLLPRTRKVFTERDR